MLEASLARSSEKGRGWHLITGAEGNVTTWEIITKERGMSKGGRGGGRHLSAGGGDLKNTGACKM